MRPVTLSKKKNEIKPNVSQKNHLFQSYGIYSMLLKHKIHERAHCSEKYSKLFQNQNCEAKSLMSNFYSTAQLYVSLIKLGR